MFKSGGSYVGNVNCCFFSPIPSPSPSNTLCATCGSAGPCFCSGAAGAAGAGTGVVSGAAGGDP